MALKQVDDGGSVHLIGDHMISETIPLLKRISITTTQQDRGRIVGRGKVPFFFMAKKKGILLNVSNISFHGIGVVQSFLEIEIFVYRKYHRFHKRFS